MPKLSAHRVVFLLLSMTLAFSMQVLASADETGAKEKAPDPFAHLKFRNLGPTVAGGRVTAVAGIPGDPNTYYVAGAAGGVFKSTDGGQTWTAIFEHEGTASIGALAVAPSNSNFLWVGRAKRTFATTWWTARGSIFRRTPGIPGNSWDSPARSKSPPFRSTLTMRTPFSSRRWDIHGAPMRTAECSKRRTVERPGRKCSS
jgi:hypothetical protein